MPKINALPPLNSPDGDDVAAFDDVSTPNKDTKKLTLTGLKTWLQGLVGWITTAMLADSSVTAVKRTQVVKKGVISAATFNTTGVKAITGIGFRPKLVLFTALPNASGSQFNVMSGAMSDAGVQHWAAFTGSSSALTRDSGTTRCIVILSTGTLTKAVEVSYSSMGDDGFNLNVNTASTVFDIAYEAIA